MWFAYNYGAVEESRIKFDQRRGHFTVNTVDRLSLDKYHSFRPVTRGLWSSHEKSSGQRDLFVCSLLTSRLRPTPLSFIHLVDVF